MSTAAVAWALDGRRTGPLDPATRLVLVVLADHAHADGSSAFPSKATISERINVSPRSVQRHLRTLEDLDLITPGDAELVSHIPSWRRPNVWDLTLHGRGDNLTPRPAGGDTQGQMGSHSASDRGDTGVSQTKNRTNPLTETPQTPHDDDADPAVLMAHEHALADHVRAPRVVQPSETGECNACAETRILVADGLCRRCLGAAVSS